MDNEEKKIWDRDGYIILKNVISKKDCKFFKNNIIRPILKKRGILLTKSKSWKRKYGEVILADDNSDHPIGIKNKYNRWDKIFESDKLLTTLDWIHGSRNKWNWLYGAKVGLGWIHLRFPISRKRFWEPPKNGWHLDGTNNLKIDPKQSVVILPLITNINSGGGGTAIVPGSHKQINDWIMSPKRKSLEEYIFKITNNNRNKIIEANGKEGDILVMNPYLIHSTSNALKNNPIRITFNLATQKIFKN